MLHWKVWCWSWNCNILVTWCEELNHWKRPWCWERLKAGGEGDEDEMVGWHHGPDGHEFEQVPEVGDGQGSLACCSSWGHKKSDTEWLNWINWMLLNMCSWALGLLAICISSLKKCLFKSFAHFLKIGLSDFLNYFLSYFLHNHAYSGFQSFGGRRIACPSSPILWVA